MLPESMPINSMRDGESHSPDYTILGRLMRVETTVNRIEQKLDTLLAKKKPKPRASKRAVYWDFFDAVWAEYPKRAGSNPKQKAFAAFKARSHEGRDKDNNINMTMAMGVNRYALFCDATGKTGTEYVMQAATFFGPDKHYENDWTIPKKKPTEDPDRQHHPTYDPSAEVIIPAGVNPYAEDM